MLMTDYYNLLDLDPARCSVEDLKRAFRQKAKLFHPDINPSPDAEETFILIHTAYTMVLRHLLGKDLLRNATEWQQAQQQQAADRAQYYARMKYEKFMKEFEAYHQAPYSWIFRILYYGLFYLYIFCAMVMAFAPLWAGLSGGIFYFVVCLPLYVLAYFTLRMANNWKKEIEPLFE
jgi:hypothetical protein